MTVSYPTFTFPQFKVEKQLFYVPGAVADGGFTAGGARITMAEPGGFSTLEIQPSLITTEWDYPLASWLMSKTNGEIFRVRLGPTPQVSIASLLRNSTGVPWDNNGPFDNGENWQGDAIAGYSEPALRGSNTLVVDMSVLGRILQRGHVIGHLFSCYMVDDISYSDDTNVATITVKPALRRDVAVDDVAYFRPWFTGQITNGADIRTTYDAENVGLIQLNKIVLQEVVI